MHTVEMWSRFWGEGFFFLPVLASYIYLALRQRRAPFVKELLIFSGLVLAVFFLPPSHALIIRLTGESVYWRLLWVLPFFPLTACAAVYLTREVRKGLPRTVLMLAVCACIALTGRSILAGNTYERVHNNQQVPDLAAGLCALIDADRGDREVLVAANDTLAAYIRVCDPALLMPYGRARHGSATREAVWVYTLLNQAPDCDWRLLARKADAAGIDYLIASSPTGQGMKYLRRKGYEVLGSVEDSTVFVHRTE